jgi:hypothetical protein
MTATPQDHKSPAAKTFTFSHNGEDFTIPAIADLPVGVMRKARKAADQGDAVFMMLEAVLDEGSPALAALDDMKADEFSLFLEGWSGKAPLGESFDS